MTGVTINALRSLIFIFPMIALIIGIISMLGFPITKERYVEIKAKIIELHEKKKQEAR